jgi:Zn-dependent peptidase ImmA (M78 family)
MAHEQMPINSALITWARERAGYSLDEAARKFANIAKWEDPQEDVRPTYPQLESLAHAFKVPVAVFFFSSPPTLPPIEETFRTLPDVALADAESRIKLLLRKAKALQLSLSELNNGRNPARTLITRDLHFPVNVDARTMARVVREYLHVTIDEQIVWPNTEKALERWRSRFADVGVFVFKDQFRSPRFAGFCLTDEEFPVIYVNNTTPKARQIFTLFHELGHLLFHTSGVDFRRDQDAPRPLAGDARRIEVLCNRFAGTILVPDDALRSALAGRAPDFQTARELADRFKVSTLVIYRKFRDLRLIDAATYAAAHQQAEEQGELEQGGGGNWYNNQMAYLGRAYVSMALSAYHQHRISEDQLADYLNIAPKNVASLEERFLKGAA